MIPATLTQAVTAFQATVLASRPIAGLSPLQRATLVERGVNLVADVDGALAAVGATLDAPEPTGHPLGMIADVRARRVAATDAAVLADLRAYLGRAVFNLAQGVA